MISYSSLLYNTLAHQGGSRSRATAVCPPKPACDYGAEQSPTPRGSGALAASLGGASRLGESPPTGKAGHLGSATGSPVWRAAILAARLVRPPYGTTPNPRAITVRNNHTPRGSGALAASLGGARRPAEPPHGEPPSWRRNWEGRAPARPQYAPQNPRAITVRNNRTPRGSGALAASLGGARRPAEPPHGEPPSWRRD